MWHVLPSLHCNHKYWNGNATTWAWYACLLHVKYCKCDRQEPNVSQTLLVQWSGWKAKPLLSHSPLLSYSQKKRNGVGLTGNVKCECILSDIIQSFCSTQDFSLTVTEMLQSADWCYSITYCLCAKLKGNVWLTVGARRIFALYDLRINVWIWNCQKKFKWQFKKNPTTSLLISTHTYCLCGRTSSRPSGTVAEMEKLLLT